MVGSRWKGRLLIIFIIAFASLADFVAPLVLGKGFLGIVKVFLILGIAFLLSASFRWVRLVLTAFLLLSFSLRVWQKLSEQLSWNDLYPIFFAPSLFPFYASLFFIGVLVWLFFKRYDWRR